MDNLRQFLVLISVPLLLLACSGTPDDDHISVDDPDNGTDVPVVNMEDPYNPTPNEAGYSPVSNATLVVTQIDSFEGQENQAYLQNAFLGLGGLPDRTIETSDRTRVYLDPDSLKIYVLYPNKNFTILGYNGIERQFVTFNYYTGGMGDYWFTPLTITYSIANQDISIRGESIALTYCSSDYWWRGSGLSFEGSFNTAINGYQGSFTYTENANERGDCEVVCTGTMELLLDD